MDKDKALESVFEIKELMEKSSKFISVSGLAAILAGIYALAGAYIATQVITSGMYLSDTLKLMAIIAMSVLVAAAVTAGILSYCKSQKTGQKFFSRLTYRALWNFSLPMLTGGVVCVSILMHEYYDILGVSIPSTSIPVSPGRNLAVVLETAAINNRQKKMGYNAAKELLIRLGLDDKLD